MIHDKTDDASTQEYVSTYCGHDAPCVVFCVGFSRNRSC